MIFLKAHQMWMVLEDGCLQIEVTGTNVKEKKMKGVRAAGFLSGM